MGVGWGGRAAPRVEGEGRAAPWAWALGGGGHAHSVCSGPAQHEALSEYRPILSEAHRLQHHSSMVDKKLVLIPLIFICLRVWSTVRFVLTLCGSPAVQAPVLVVLHVSSPPPTPPDAPPAARACPDAPASARRPGPGRLASPFLPEAGSVGEGAAPGELTGLQVRTCQSSAKGPRIGVLADQPRGAEDALLGPAALPSRLAPRRSRVLCLSAPRQGIGNTFQGGANCIMFVLCTRVVRTRLLALCCCRPLQPAAESRAGWPPRPATTSSTGDSQGPGWTPRELPST